MHAGSLATALASCLEARAHAGHWKLRIEDIDRPRCVPGLDLAIIQSLARLGFEWDGDIVYQSRRLPCYAAALERLQRAGRTYECGCSRRELGDSEADTGYPGHCRLQRRGLPPYAVRFRGDDERHESFDDLLQGRQEQRWSSIGDPVIRRRDQLYAYQLAVVVDDADAGVTHVVRGNDLLGSTPWQLALQRVLGLLQPRYLHLPLVTDPDGSKLSKSGQAEALERQPASVCLYDSLRLLRQQPPAQLRVASVAEIWRWAREHWQPQRLHGVAQLRMDSV